MLNYLIWRKYATLLNYFNKQFSLLDFNIFVCNKRLVDLVHILFAFANVLESEQLFLDSQVSKEVTCGSMALCNPKRFMQKTHRP